MRRLRIILKVIGAFGLAVTALGFASLGLYYWLFVTVPDPVEPARGDTRIVAGDGTVLSVMMAQEHAQPVCYSDISRAVVEAVVAKEDAAFFAHSGLDYGGILRALIANLQAGAVVQGGSTITQQYVKTTLDDHSRTFKRKFQEMLIARKAESALSKEEILARYLNSTYFGRGAYGIEAAARVYFGTTAAELDYPQAALLAVIISAPSLKGPAAQEEEMRAQRNALLERMAALGYLTRGESDSAVAAPLGVVKQRTDSDVKWPYVVDQVKRELLEVLPPELAFSGGLTIVTSLDPRLQRAAEKSAYANLPEAAGLEIAVASVEPSSGFVRAMVAGRDYDVSQFNLAVQARRQPGSAFKPFVLAAALEGGLDPDEPLLAGGTPYVTRYVDLESGEPRFWSVSNYEDQPFGRLSLTEATVFSVNTIFAQLVGMVGPSAVVDVAHRAGIESPLEPQPAIALGGLETGVSPLEMAVAYATFANVGERVSARYIVRVLDADGETLYHAQPGGAEAIEADVAMKVTSILQQVLERGTGVRARLDRSAAGKTGTSQMFRDAWFVGYTPELSTAVWMGYPEAARSMEEAVGKAAGGTVPAETWHDYMMSALQDAPVLTFQTEDVELVEICRQTYTLAVPECPDVEVIALPSGSVPTELCTMH
ncbi:MAG: transglycosylase domain-containing protein [Thermoleophilia bacterium]